MAMDEGLVPGYLRTDVTSSAWLLMLGCDDNAPVAQGSNVENALGVGLPLGNQQQDLGLAAQSLSPSLT